MAELLPCPFCGGRATTSHGVFSASGSYFVISCKSCGCRTPNFHEWIYGQKYEQEAIKMWNTRTQKAGD